ncbi:CDA_G0029990.mRNA.1.CDS.1 [Saccharomyces cerevisiae]|nr:CDA_G0029990.mRNA.1.CDS.1 [Saccharomyces cerevisiae]CAI7363018.1 CDA_G0029990.mRNA.1.CDS.1 [Saccharomyces cerevisiae]
MSGTANSRRKEVLRVPVIDLNRVTANNKTSATSPDKTATLLQHDTFLLKNYANKAVLDALLAGLTTLNGT